MDYTGIFMVVGGVVFLAGIWAGFQDPSHESVPPQKLRMFLKRRYWLYYLLTFMSGARRQIYMVFSMFLLVKVFHFSVQMITDHLPAGARRAVLTAHYVLIAGFGALVAIFGWQVTELNSQSFSPALNINLRWLYLS